MAIYMKAFIPTTIKYTMIALILFIVCASYTYYWYKRNQKRKQEEERAQARKSVLRQALTNLENCATLTDLLELHKSFCEPLDLNNSKGLGPCKWGIFRTQDISKMLPSEVYLGDIYGIWTNTLDEFEKCEETMAGNGFGIDPAVKIKDLIFNQYYKQLKCNFKAMLKDVENGN